MDKFVGVNSTVVITVVGNTTVVVTIKKDYCIGTAG